MSRSISWSTVTPCFKAWRKMNKAIIKSTHAKINMLIKATELVGCCIIMRKIYTVFKVAMMGAIFSWAARLKMIARGSYGVEGELRGLLGRCSGFLIDLVSHLHCLIDGKNRKQKTSIIIFVMIFDY